MLVFLNMLLNVYLESICLNLVNPKLLLMKILLPILLIFSGVNLSATLNQLEVVISFQEKTIHPKDLPENIRKYVTDNYNGAQITKAVLNQRPGSNNEYSVFINFKQQQVILKFDKNGEFVRKE